MGKKSCLPRILIFDIETIPIVANVWGLFDQNVGLNQILHDWCVISWAAKWHKEPTVFYKDQRKKRNVRDDRTLLKGIWKLLNEADVVITQNGKKFDAKKLNARFIINGFKPPSPYKHIDILQLNKSNFGFTSNKLEYVTDKLCKKYKKLKHKKFPGQELWDECIAGNMKAWKEMEKYNIHDVLSTEEAYDIVAPWCKTPVDFNVYRKENEFKCQCGSGHLKRRGYLVTKSGKFQRYQCQDCGAWTSDLGAKHNLLSKAKRDSLKGK